MFLFDLVIAGVVVAIGALLLNTFVFSSAAVEVKAPSAPKAAANKAPKVKGPSKAEKQKAKEDAEIDALIAADIAQATGKGKGMQVDTDTKKVQPVSLEQTRKQNERVAASKAAPVQAQVASPVQSELRDLVDKAEGFVAVKSKPMKKKEKAPEGPKMLTEEEEMDRKLRQFFRGGGGRKNGGGGGGFGGGRGGGSGEDKRAGPSIQMASKLTTKGWGGDDN